MSGDFSESALGAGAQLRAAREAGGLSIADVAARLKLSGRQIEAIEAEDWKSLPEPTFTRGFIRGYARLVGIEESALRLDIVRPAARADLAPTPTAMGEVTYEGGASKTNVARWLIPLCLLAALIGGASWFILNDVRMPTAASKSDLNAPSLKSAISTVAADATSAAAANATVPVAANAAPTPSSVPSMMNPPPMGSSAQPSTSADAPATSPNLLNTPPAATSALATPGAAVQSPVVPATAPLLKPPAPAAAAPAPVATPSADGKKRVVLIYGGLSWTEIRSKGEVVLSERVNTGTREVMASPPISFVVGNANNVTITVDGKPYDFSQSVRSEVARFRIE
jgi:cytoskeleton protein RodZ